MSPIPPTHPNELPASFGRYRLMKLLGKGGMGSVFLAHDPQLDRSVALKVPQFGSTETASVLARFLTEARAAAALHHPNICPIHEVGNIDGIPYLTMAFVEGKSLGEYAALRPLSPRQSAALVRKLALALDEAHKRGVVHRDLKPANVMIDRRGEPVIMDFGLARRARAGDPRLTQDGACMGTPAYMPPEQVKGEIDAVGPASDIYSLGVILYELLARQLPFSGDMMAVLARVVTEEPPPPSQFCPDLDPELEAICLKAMAKEIEDRYDSMAELAAALLEYLRGNTAATQSAGPAKGSKPAPAVAARNNPRRDTATEPEGMRVSQMGGLRSMAMLNAQLPPSGPANTEKPRPRKSKRAHRQRFPLWGWLVACGAGTAVVLLVGLWAAGVFRARPTVDPKPPSLLADQARPEADPKPPPPTKQDSGKSKLPSPGVVGMWEHTVKAKKINLRIELLANGTIKGSYGGLPSTWVLEGSTLTLTWGEKGTLGKGIWRDVCTVAADGTSYTGRDLQNDLVEGKRVSSADTSVDLLKILDLKRNVIEGNWQWVGDTLVSPRIQDNTHPRVQPEYVPPEEYQIEMLVERIDDGGGAINIGFVMDGIQACVLVDSFCAIPKEKVSGIEKVDGKYGRENETTRRGRLLQIRQGTELRVVVRRRQVTFFCRNTQVFDWHGDPDRLSLFRGWIVPDKRSLFFGAHGSFIIHKWTVRPLPKELRQ